MDKTQRAGVREPGTVALSRSGMASGGKGVICQL